jgi:hypothetical protein
MIIPLVSGSGKVQRHIFNQLKEAHGQSNQTPRVITHR